MHFITEEIQMVSKCGKMFDFSIDQRDTNEMRICLLPYKTSKE